MRRRLMSAVAVLLVLVGGLWLYAARERGRPRENFAEFLDVFAGRYALFDVKSVPWNDMRAQYEARVDADTTDDELFDLMRDILQTLDDKHCYIYRFNEIYFSGFGLPPRNYVDLLSFDFRVPTGDFSLDLVEDRYLEGACGKGLKICSFLPPVGIRHVFTTGMLTETIAYLHMTEMSNRAQGVHEAIADFVETYGASRGFVIDLRDNIGGYALPARELAAHFADTSRVYAVSRLRQPHDVHAFRDPERWTIEPSSDIRLDDRPVVVLTNGNTQSAAELFALMMQTLPNVTLIGSTTAGVFADTHVGKLSNGWEYRLSIRKTSNADDVCLEGVGIEPDIAVGNTPADIAGRRDRVIECAVEHLQATLGDLHCR